MQKYFMTHAEVISRARRLVGEAQLTKDSVLFPVPRGGVPVAYLLAGICQCGITDDLAQATCIVDDIVDSGKTRESFSARTDLHFGCLVDKQKNSEDFALGWIVFPWEQGEAGAEVSADDISTRFLQFIGEDVNRDGLKDSPQRVQRAWTELYAGYKQDPAEILARAFNNDGQYDEMIVLRDIEFFSTCEHHFLPFFGRAHIAYIPTKESKVVGISKLARLVDCFARRLQIQERMTQQIATTIDEVLRPLGVGVLIEAEHLCMRARGVQKQNSIMVTSALKGILKTEASRLEFLGLIGKR